MPETERDTYDLFYDIWTTALKDAKALIERVHAMPICGVSSSFIFGKNYGFLRGCLIGIGIPFEEVTPHVWQRSIGCLTHGKKNISKAKAQQLFPHLKITHHTADSVLICEYLRRKEAQRI